MGLTARLSAHMAEVGAHIEETRAQADLDQLSARVADARAPAATESESTQCLSQGRLDALAEEIAAMRIDARLEDLEQNWKGTASGITSRLEAAERGWKVAARMGELQKDALNELAADVQKVLEAQGMDVGQDKASWFGRERSRWSAEGTFLSKEVN